MSSIVTPAEITLTREEALVVDSLLLNTAGTFTTDADLSTSEGVEEFIRRLGLEATIRDVCDWWGTTSPGHLDMRAHAGDTVCPDAFTLPPEAARALVELLPIAFGDTLPSDIETTLALAARLGVEVTVTATALTVPREFLEAFLVSANIGVMGAAELIDNNLSLSDAIARRANDGELIASFSASAAVRDTVMLAIDEGAPVGWDVVRALAESTLNDLLSDLTYLTTHKNTDPDELVNASTRLRDFTAWLKQNNLMPAKAVTA